TRQFQMLQQNSYFPSRYLPWVKANFLPAAAAQVLSAVLWVLLLTVFPVGAVIFAAFLLGFRVFRAIRIQKISIKKLVFTGRVKRLYAAAAVWLALLLAACFLPVVPRLLPVCVFSLFAMLTPLTTLFCRTVNTPVENGFVQYYIHDAKRILAGHPGLIVIGVTGSYGKTSTKFILARLLSEKYNVVATPQSFNTPMGVVRTIREHLQPQTQIFICEMGAKKVGDIREICEIVHPQYGIITSVGAQHLETFGTIDRVFQTKFELADEVLKNGGQVFAGGDSAELIRRIDPSRYQVYGTDPAFPFCASRLTCGRNGSSFTLSLNGQEIALSTPLLGLHNVLNIAGAAAVAATLGVKDEEIRFAAASLRPAEHRLELKTWLGGSLMIDDAYNANPEGCMEAVRVLSHFEEMKKVIITPGLVELGDREDEYNRKLGVESAGICDIIILVGKNRSRPIKEGALSAGFPAERLHVAASFREASEIFASFADAKTVVLLENDLPDNYLY
ncbi:MAG: UDP-N-acetylmuramoyl-tripeptide--D-alanyl-D-alanine ligase, partial [Clostridia bacterium]|nr:UDP-N-acetylmuramoyl-tripeptide--D-alanyl-D-alanine ligase [Clostridia bacterium]